MSFINIKWCHISYAIRAIQLYSCQICNLILYSNLHILIPRYSEDILGLLVLFSVILVILSLVYLINIEGPIIQSYVGFAGRKKEGNDEEERRCQNNVASCRRKLVAMLLSIFSFHYQRRENHGIRVLRKTSSVSNYPLGNTFFLSGLAILFY